MANNNFFPMQWGDKASLKEQYQNLTQLAQAIIAGLKKESFISSQSESSDCDIAEVGEQEIEVNLEAEAENTSCSSYDDYFKFTLFKDEDEITQILPTIDVTKFSLDEFYDWLIQKIQTGLLDNMFSTIMQANNQRKAFVLAFAAQLYLNLSEIIDNNEKEIINELISIYKDLNKNFNFSFDSCDVEKAIQIAFKLKCKDFLKAAERTVAKAKFNLQKLINSNLKYYERLKDYPSAKEPEDISLKSIIECKLAFAEDLTFESKAHTFLLDLYNALIQEQDVKKAVQEILTESEKLFAEIELDEVIREEESAKSAYAH